MTILDRIKQAQDRKRELVDIPEWGVSVWVATVSGLERDRWETIRQKSNATTVGLRASFAVLVCQNEDGTPLFSEADEGWLGEKSAAALNRIFDVGLRLNGFTKSDRDELEKNSAAAPSDNSGFA